MGPDGVFRDDHVQAPLSRVAAAYFPFVFNQRHGFVQTLCRLRFSTSFETQETEPFVAAPANAVARTHLLEIAIQRNQDGFVGFGYGGNQSVWRIGGDVVA